MSIDSATRERLFHLPPKERAALAHELISSLEPGQSDPENEQLWDAEIERRAAAADRGETKFSDWRDAVERIRNSLKRD